MGNPWDGTHLFIWKPEMTCNGNIADMIVQAKKLGITGVVIKFANGSLAGDMNSQSYMHSFKKLIGPFKSEGFKVGGWIYQYLTDVQGEVDACLQAIEAGVDWITLDGEVELKGKNAQVAQFGQLFRAKYPSFPLGLSSFAIADLHPEVPFNEYNKFVNVMLPQIYWGEMKWDVAKAFESSIESYSKFGKPIAPTGQTYGVSAPQMAQFVELCKQEEFTHVSWWDWQESSEATLQAIGSNLIHPPVPVNPLQQWEIDAQSFAEQHDISDGTRPHDNATRAEIWAMMQRLYEKLGGK